jgi:hypothetical protein
MAEVAMKMYAHCWKDFSRTKQNITSYMLLFNIILGTLM